MEFLNSSEGSSYDGVTVPCVARRIGGRWQFTIIAPTWFINDIDNELGETGAFSVVRKTGYKIVLGQKLPLID